MNDSKLELCQERDLRGLFTLTTAFIKQNFKLYLKTLLIYAFPFMLLTELVLILRNFAFSNTYLDIDQNFESILWIGSYVGTLGNMIFYVIAYVISLAITCRFVQLYIKSEEINLLSTKNIWDESKGKLKWVATYSLLMIFIVFFPFMVISFSFTFGPTLGIDFWLLFSTFFAVIIFLCCYVATALIVPVKMEEKELSLSAALYKSFLLTKQSWWKSFRFILISTMFVMIIPILISELLFYVIYYIVPFQELTVVSFLVALVKGITNSFVSLISSFFYIFISILFYSLHEKLNNSHLKNQIDSIGTNLNYDTTDGI